MEATDVDAATAAATQYAAGAFLALMAKGRQDVYVDKALATNADLFDVKSQFLRERHQVVYNKLDVKTERQGQCVKLTLKRSCDFVNRVDLVIGGNAIAAPVNRMLQRVDVECGGQRIDCLGGSDMDIETQIKTNCVIMNSGKQQQQRRIMHLNERTYIPLVMGMAFVCATNHEHCVYVTFTEDFDLGKISVELYGNVYFLDTPGRKLLYLKSNDFVTIQNQFCGAETIGPGYNSFDLNFNHPVYLIYFWGFDKSKVTNVKLLLNGAAFYDGCLNALEYFKTCSGYGDAEPCMIFFSQDRIGEPVRSSVNFSRLDKAQLVITTSQTEESRVYIVGLNMQPVRMMNGLIGLAFSK